MQLDPNLLLLLSDRLRRNVGMNGQAQMPQTTRGRGLDPNLALMMQAMNGGQHYDTQGRLMLPNAGPQGSALDNQEFSRLDAARANQPRAGSRYAQSTFATGPRDRAAVSTGPIMNITSRPGHLGGGEQGPTQYREERMPMQDVQAPRPTVAPRPAYGAGPWRPNAPAPVAPNFGVPQMPKPPTGPQVPLGPGPNTDSVYARWPQPQGYSPESWQEFKQQQADESSRHTAEINRQLEQKLRSIPRPDYAAFQQMLQNNNAEQVSNGNLFWNMFAPQTSTNNDLLLRSVLGAGGDQRAPDWKEVGTNSDFVAKMRARERGQQSEDERRKFYEMQRRNRAGFATY